MKAITNWKTPFLSAGPCDIFAKVTSRHDIVDDVVADFTGDADDVNDDGEIGAPSVPED